MFLAGSGVSVLIGFWSNCMNTRFQYSRKRSFSPPGRSSGLPNVEAAVEVQLRARAARPGRADLPEVLRARALDDPLTRDADLEPGLDRLLVRTEAELVVAGEHGDPDVLLVEAEALAGQVPRVTAPPRA